ncbi:hypothetical protein [Kamptonema sp. UHCC 0994]|uniref:hypothetical protein n=1 Tax=Kamptonema sp. UHCC 0994 TaxID=3031329 RepID=UPI0023BA2BBC|nr:hypothetical protein [Kamptonema sp. UHCC 0994]MDF0552324.1 hypothetical protein [Kamptonema sp. UHCC 0994]
MRFLSEDAAGDRGSTQNSKAKSNQNVEIDMSSTPESKENPINQIFGKIEDILYATWQETGFGKISIESERAEKGKGKIHVTVKGSTYYRYYISDRDVKEGNLKE